MTGPLEGFRREIDAIDDALVDLLVRRFGIVRAVAVVKRRERLSVVQSARAQEVVERNAARAAQGGVEPDLARRIWTLMIDEAHRIEHDIVSDDGTHGDGGAR
jgi:chorismate mutase